MGTKKISSDSLPCFSNSKARHKFLLGDKFIAGIELRGTEVKSIRNGKAQISESLPGSLKMSCTCTMLMWMNIHLVTRITTSQPVQENYFFIKREINRLQSAVEASGKTIVPLKLFFKGALIKCELALGTGKNQRDKRQDLKKRVAQREAEQAMKNSLKR